MLDTEKNSEMPAMFCALVALSWASLSSASCRNDPYFGDTRTMVSTCAYPLSAVESFLQGDPHRAGPCAVFSPQDRFLRFSEWIRSLGGYISPKIEFHRGHYVDPISKTAKYSIGGIYLKPNEEIVQNEMLMYVPFRATFSEHMIRVHIPWFRKFVYMQSPRLWMSFGLAALLAHFPDVLGPWAALLPDVSNHPIMWPEADIQQLLGTNTYYVLSTIRAQLSSGCPQFENHLESLDITCTQVYEAYAIIMSRSFGLEIIPGDASSAIPFGPDLLNHSPHTVSWIGTVNPPPQDGRLSSQDIFDSQAGVLYTLRSFVLGPTRELYNNYGQHGMSMDLAMYGFTAPDPVDELVIVSTLGGVFEGVHYPLTRKEICPKGGRNTLTVSSYPTCLHATYKTLSYHQDSAGYHRLTNGDYLSFYPGKMLNCSNTVGGFQWKWMTRELDRLSVRLDEQQYILHLNVMDGAEPHMNHQTSVWMALCALPSYLPGNVVMKILDEMSVCKSVHTSKYYHNEEYPLHPAVRNLAKKSLLELCSIYQANVLQHHVQNFLLWLSARNENCRRRGCAKKIFDFDLQGLNSRSFLKLLNQINSTKNRIWSDNGGTLESMSHTFRSNRSSTVARMEEIFKFKMQMVYMLFQKCRSPLETAVHQHSVAILSRR